MDQQQDKRLSEEEFCENNVLQKWKGRVVGKK